MFQRIALLKLTEAHARDDVRAAASASLRTAIRAGGYDGEVGLPADEPSLKSWDLSVTVRFRTRAQLEGFDSAEFLRSASGLSPEAVAVVKGWSFEG